MKIPDDGRIEKLCQNVKMSKCQNGRDGLSMRQATKSPCVGNSIDQSFYYFMLSFRKKCHEANVKNVKIYRNATLTFLHYLPRSPTGSRPVA